jgi:3-phosphoshikimate 1-carboxyvinyltransferase
VPPLGADFAVQGRGRRGLLAPLSALDCGNSGTTTRLMAGVVAGHPFSARFVGDGSLSRRPMRRVARPLEAMGARVELHGGDGLPMTVTGSTLHAIEWETEAASAQVKSAILLAGLVSGVAVSVREPEPTRDHTERMLRALGVPVASDGPLVRLPAVSEPLPRFALDVPGDPSSAAFFAALAALADEGELALPHVLLNETRTGFMRALRRMGARIEVEDVASDASGEEVGTYRVGPGELRPTVVGARDVPSMIDEIPMLACVAARADGNTLIRGAHELRVKESDRITAVVSNLRAIGVDAEELPDGMRVRGSRRPLSGTVRSHGDHRLAMAFGVLGAARGNDISIDDGDCVSVSYPGFWKDLAAAAQR